ncbi:MAG: bifunctional 4-hydroxy-3-methylbut-2-enyl diphosphate reductase/30S ribosomal protein S1 [Clostridiales bacterium]|nr:bifunctional 4-hydroxy-3-methylbut-2-enyl diphosphate reductase/30S ribosomal protein S1 [Clostridiales bacterium]
MTIEVAKTAGFCMGVERAVRLTEEQCRTHGKVYTLGQLIHNTAESERLCSIGVTIADTIEDIPEGSRVVIRAHGVGRDVYDALKKKNAEIIDATCPFVKKIHRIAETESADRRTIFIFGSPVHPEVRGIVGWSGESIVAENIDDFEKWLRSDENNRYKRIAIVAQTTSNVDKWEIFLKYTRKQCTNVKIFDTICSATDERQAETRSLAKRSDCMLVIGDSHSSNTVKLADISRQECGNVFLIGSADELGRISLPTKDRIGVTAGASAPGWLIKEVVNKMSDEIKNTEIMETSENQSFEELLEQSVRTLYTGDRVTGIITQITSGEIQVDLGVKHAAYIPESEISDDPLYNIEENLKVGQEIEAFVVRVNDAEGMIMLSKKKMDSIRGWDRIEEAKANDEILEGVVVEDNKGGIVVSVNGIRVFVPFSQTGLPRDADLSDMVKKTVKLRIREVQRARRRVVGSIRDVLAAERREMSEKLWAEIEVGKTYKGVVKNLTSYGVFVDIGGVDGMVHISELSWGRVRHPSEVMQVGDIVEVFVLSFDAEKKRISLGYRKASDNPWNKFISNCSIGDVVSVKVLKFMPFGAFAEILPGVDGLIHISQIANRRIAKPDDVLTEGEIIDVKITDIDYEKQKVSLSIRALLETLVVEVPVEEAAIEKSAATEEYVYVAEAPVEEDDASKDEALTVEVSVVEVAVEEDAASEETV